MKAFFALKKTNYSVTEGMKYPLHINNMGYYLGATEDISVSRPRGREDYHLIYVSSGRVKAGDVYLESGDLYLFYPHEVQEYTYIKQAESLYYWIHFTGSEATAILERAELSSGYRRSNGRKREADSLFRLLTEAIAYAKVPSTPYSTSLLHSLFHLLGASPIQAYPFSKAVKMLEDTSASSPIREIAKTYQMTTAHFIRCFKEAYGIAPAGYRTSCRIAQAKSLLTSTSLPIASIAEMCGFSDPLYFSRIFKRYANVSPSLYRKRQLDI